MKRLAPLFIVLLLAAVTYATSSTPGQPPTSVPTSDSAPAPASATAAATTNKPTSQPADNEARVIRIVDGDSMFITYQGERREMRLMGIDAPEGRQEWGEEARDYTHDWTEGKTLQLTFGSRQTDKYDRLLAYVWDGDRLLNLEIVRDGFALPYMLKKHEPYFKEINHALKEAKYEGTGFWKQGGLKMEPRIWRKKHK